MAQCPDRLLKLQEVQETDKDEMQEANELMIHETVYLNEGKIVPSNYEVSNKEDDVWYLDNRASNHMSGDKRYFSSIDDSITGKVWFGDDSRIDIKGKGTIEFTDRNGDARKITDVYFIPESGCDVRMKGEDLTMHYRDGKLIAKATRSRNRLYKVRMGLKESICYLSTKASDSSRCHARLGHINLDTMKSMITQELVVGIPNMEIETKVCGSCMLGKQARQSFPKATMFRASKVLELVHGDLCEPITPSTSGGNRYIFVLIDDYSRYMWSALLKEKSDVFEKFKNFKAMVEQETKLHIETFRTDRGGEFVSKEFNSLCDKSGIKLHHCTL